MSDTYIDLIARVGRNDWRFAIEPASDGPRIDIYEEAFGGGHDGAQTWVRGRAISIPLDVVQKFITALEQVADAVEECR